MFGDGLACWMFVMASPLEMIIIAAWPALKTP